MQQFILCFFLLFASQFSHAYTQTELEIFDNEPPIVKDLLLHASLLISDEKNADSAWQAANLYCEASRYGSAEGVYRLGMLYAFGRGVPANRNFAANLFGIASTHGHYEAQKMLETIEITTNDTPLCVLEAVAPERAPVIQSSTTQKSNYAGSPGIDSYVENLPKNKLWVVELVGTIAEWYKVDPKLVLSIITAESNFKVTAKSNANAHGLMQLIPATAERFNVKNAYNASQNIKGGVAYLRWLLSYFRGDVTLAVAAYNAGEGAVDRYHGVPPYKETKNYVKKVMALYQSERHQFDDGLTRASPALNAKPVKINVKKVKRK